MCVTVDCPVIGGLVPFEFLTQMEFPKLPATFLAALHASL